MVKNQAYRMAMLFDFYGDMLTERQREFYEIAENYGISRQGVRDVIVRAEATLTELEDKTGIIRRFHVMQDQLKNVQRAVTDISQRNTQQCQDEEIENLVKEINAILDQLRQE